MPLLHRMLFVMRISALVCFCRTMCRIAAMVSSVNVLRGRRGGNAAKSLVRDTNEDPLDDVDVLVNQNVDERGAVGIDTPEREEAPAASAIEGRKNRNAVAPDPHDDRVVDSCRNPVRRVNHQ